MTYGSKVTDIENGYTQYAASGHTPEIPELDPIRLPEKDQGNYSYYQSSSARTHRTNIDWSQAAADQHADKYSENAPADTGGKHQKNSIFAILTVTDFHVATSHCR